jgi:trigger factor
MNVEKEQLNACTVKLTIEVDPAEVQEAIGIVKRQIAKGMRVPGFRPGKAPAALVEQFIEKDTLFQRVGEHLVQRTYPEAIKQEGLEPYGGPAVELQQLDEENPFIYTAKVPLPPQVTLGEYKGLAAERPDPTPTDEEIDGEIAELRRRRAKQTPVERPAQEGDLAVVTVKPEEAENGKRFMVIVGQTFPQLDQELMGMSAGETKNALLTFPENFEEADWAGKPFDCAISLASLSSVEVPEFDDEFAKHYNVDTADELRTKISERIHRMKEIFGENEVEESLFKSLVDQSTIEMPDTIWEGVYRDEWRSLERQQAKEETTVEAYAANQGLTVEQLREHVKEDAQTQVKRALLIRDIAEQEKFELTEDEIRAQIQRLAERAGVGYEVAQREIARQQGMDEVRFRAMYAKVAAFMKEHANIVTVRR